MIEKIAIKIADARERVTSARIATSVTIVQLVKSAEGASVKLSLIATKKAPDVVAQDPAMRCSNIAHDGVVQKGDSFSLSSLKKSIRFAVYRCRTHCRRRKMAQKFLFGNLPELKASREADLDILKKANNRSASPKTRSIRVANEGHKWGAKVAAAVDSARRLLVDDGSLICIRDEVELFKYIDKIKKNRTGGIDLETTGLDPIDDHVVGVCLYTPGEKGAYIPIRHTDFDNNILPDQITPELMTEALAEIADVPMDYHNAIFDWRFVRNDFGLELRIGWCCLLAANYLNEYESHALKPLWDKYVSKQEDTSATFGALFKGIPFNYIPIDIAYLYAGKDPKITYELAEFQREFLLPTSQKAIQKGLAEAGKFLTEVEIPLIKHIGRIEDKGVEIDADLAEKLRVKYTQRQQEAKEEIHEVISAYDLHKLSLEERSKLDTPINIDSTHQLGVIFFDLLNLNNGNRQKPRSTDAAALEHLRSKYPEHKDLLDRIQEYRGMGKLLSTYIEKMPAIVKAKTGRLHCRFNQYGARTGRFSSEGPNMQNIPSRGEKKEIRKIVRAALNKIFISADFSQQEPRVLAHLCFLLFQDRSMIDAYLSGKDLYSWMAAEIYGVDYEDCKEKHPNGDPNPDGKKRRDSVKAILLGLMYGMQLESLAESLHATKEEAQKIMDMLFDAFPAIKRVIDHYQEMARREGFILTVFGRKCRIPDMQLPKYEFVYVDNKDEYVEDTGIIEYYTARLDNAKYAKTRRQIWDDANARGIWIIDNSRKISDAERQVLNSVVQGTSADITKLAMLKIGEDEKLREWGFEMTLTIHDEVDGECPEEHALEVGDRLAEIMIDSCKSFILTPMRVDVDRSAYWTGDDVTKELQAKYAS
jgi:DNA polymerase I-like protein with 3'-5' exonuclease and polymerase domains